MNLLKTMIGSLVMVAALVLLSGCETTSNAIVRPRPQPVCRIGELVSVKFSGVDTVPPEHEERVKEDGTITLSQIGAVKADGKTPGDLQRDIRALYVPRFFSEGFTVTVRGQDRFFYVGGEVKLNNRYQWVEGMTVVKAIQNAGGLTEWASGSKVIVTGQDGKTFKFNYVKALLKPELDVFVYPDDSINVYRKGW